ncbi:dihydrofolate reductase family protein [Herbiconiux ginsengi]|uniref:Dihydrofolate reductase n=1 Tax=Herbiconiux ginsengi TaxID=381665 RepID=A0A1H3PPZ7_9MICO|nr:dihydrofolate reductase family protein [Herbiconiux ginsengi]SDZ03116.1 Dihydrofolate reductase [Herbiconiux ginsengi]
MTKTQYYVAASIDGFIADRDNGLDWLMQFGFEEFTADYEAFIAGVGVVVMGSRTYEFLLDDNPEKWPYPDHVSWVLTNRVLPLIPGGDIRMARGDVTELHEEWVEAAGDKKIWIVGGGLVAAQVADAGLLDEILLTTMPVVLGAGAPILPLSGTSGVFDLVSTQLFPSGAIGAVYRTRR